MTRTQTHAERVLAVTVRLLPARRREWGAAMLAELAGIDQAPRRWLFTLGCVVAVVTRPAVWRHFAHPLLTAGILVVTVRGTARVAYPPMRWGLLGLVAVLLLVTWLGRLRPVAPGRAARGVRAAGYLLVGLLAAEVVVSLGHKDNHDLAGIPVFAVMLTGYLLGFLALTAHRSAATGPTLVTGTLTGVAAAAAWAGVVAAFPPIPPDVSLALLVTVLGMAAAAWAAARRGSEAALLSGVCAGAVAALLILQTVALLSVFGPDRLIPDLVPAALTPADDVANSRVEIQDPYLWLLLAGWLIALAAAVVSRPARRPGAAGAVARVSPSR